MRSLFFLPALLIYTTSTQAQVGFGPLIGIGTSSMRFIPVDGYTSASASAIFSGRIGGIADVPLNKKLYLQPSIFLSRKGGSRDFSFYTSAALNGAHQQTLNINYVDMPVNVLYKTGTQGRGRVMLGLGVTPSYIIGGRNKLHTQGAINDTPFNYTTNTQIRAGTPLALFDIGVDLIAGYELPTGLFFQLYYTAGAKDIGLGGETDKNRMWGISAGYIFGKGRNINKEAASLIDKSTD